VYWVCLGSTADIRFVKRATSRGVSSSEGYAILTFLPFLLYTGISCLSP
jgi:hypothetical protein